LLEPREEYFPGVGEGRTMRMRKVFHCAFTLVLLLCVFLIHPPNAAAQLVVNEFVADPARDWNGDGIVNSRDDEWVEIVNLGTAVVDLAAYRLADSEGSKAWRYGFSGTLGPGMVRIVYGSESKAWEEANKCPQYGLHLNNTGDRVALYRIEGTDTSLVDGYTYGPVSVVNDRSIGRRPDNPQAWVTYDALNKCTATCDPTGTGCAPTPGAPNVCMTPVAARSWGKIKSMYR
jgi:hypothetical protein